MNRREEAIASFAAIKESFGFGDWSDFESWAEEKKREFHIQMGAVSIRYNHMVSEEEARRQSEEIYEEVRRDYYPANNA